MIDYGNKFLIAARSAARKLGLLRPVVRLYRRLANKNYEQAFDEALFAEVNLNDIVWDVGANVGFYTRKFAEKVGSGGHVVAFEPSPRTLQTLRAAVSAYPQVTVIPVALSNQTGTAAFVDDPDSHATNSLRSAVGDENIVQVKVEPGDAFARDICPDVIKMDVEGFEVETVDGLKETLLNKKLRALFLEVHFLEISRRGVDDGVARITQTIENAGMSIRWIDPSHFIAKRVAA